MAQRHRYCQGRQMTDPDVCQTFIPAEAEGRSPPSSQAPGVKLRPAWKAALGLIG